MKIKETTFCWALLWPAEKGEKASLERGMRGQILLFHSRQEARFHSRMKFAHDPGRPRVVKVRVTVEAA